MLYVSKITPIFNPYFKKGQQLVNFQFVMEKCGFVWYPVEKAIGRILP